MQKKDDIVKIYDDMFNLIGTESWDVVHEKDYCTRSSIFGCMVMNRMDAGFILYSVQKTRKFPRSL